MNTCEATVFGARFMLAISLAAFANFASAQGVPAEHSVLEPAVDTSAALEPAVDTSTERGDELDASEPSVPALVLTTDVRRQQADGAVMDRIDLGRTEITGNQELPKVLYIVPWKKSDPGDLTGQPVNTLLDEVLAPLDREEFVRQVDYYGDLYGEQE